MSKPNSIGIGFLGLTAKDLAVFERVIEFGEKKNKFFHRCPTTAAKILIANDDPESIENAQKTASQTLIVVSNTTEVNKADYVIKRPLLITKVMRTLDESSKQYIKATKEPVKNTESVSQQDSTFHALVVDDSAAIRKQLEIELRGTAISADYANCGEDALALIEKNKYDLVFLDIVMPGINGYEVCKIIRAKTDYKRTPVIMLSGKTGPLDEVEGILAGASTYLLKPVKHQDFQNTLSRISKWLHNFA